TAARAAASMTLIMTGVASTAIRPEPTNGAVLSGVTMISAWPVRPAVTRERSGMAGLIAETPWIVAKTAAREPITPGDRLMPKGPSIREPIHARRPYPDSLDRRR